MDNTFIGFVYSIDNQQYVEAYPLVYSKYTSYIKKTLNENGIEYRVVTAPSRNAARRHIYQTYIDPSGKGFNKMPYRYNAT